MPSSNGPRNGTREKLSNDPRDSGTSPPQPAVRSYDEGETVHLKLDPSVPDGRFHPRFDGLTGEVVGEQGAAYQVLVNDGGKDKQLVVKPAHIRSQQE